jgi:acyl-homoserine lactone acylase PvdQ
MSTPPPERETPPDNPATDKAGSPAVASSQKAPASTVTALTFRSLSPTKQATGPGRPGNWFCLGQRYNDFEILRDASRQRLQFLRVAFGESGDPASPHWFDQAALYAKKQFKPSWYARADVEAHSERHYHPGEPTAGGRVP